jgi:serine/threonine protein kinase
MLQLCQHVRVLHLVEHFETPAKIYMITGRCYGDVARIYNARPRSITVQLAVRWVQQLLEGLCHIHSFGVVHRDIKMSNMLLISPSSDSICIADFGFAEYATDLLECYRDPEKINDLRGTPLLLAPEVFLGEPQTLKSDVWSCGLVMYELLTHSHPFLPHVSSKTKIAAEIDKTPRWKTEKTDVSTSDEASDAEEKNDPARSFPRLARCFSSSPHFVERFVSLAHIVTSKAYPVDYGHAHFVRTPSLQRVVEAMLTDASQRASCSDLLQDALFADGQELDVYEEEAPTRSMRALGCSIARMFGFGPAPRSRPEPLPIVAERPECPDESSESPRPMLVDQ